jgi:hypothetical protein
MQFLEYVGYPCKCGHEMGTHDIGAASYSEVVESAEELRCVAPDCDCADYTVAAIGGSINE